MVFGIPMDYVGFTEEGGAGGLWKYCFHMRNAVLAILCREAGRGQVNGDSKVRWWLFTNQQRSRNLVSETDLLN